MGRVGGWGVSSVTSRRTRRKRKRGTAMANKARHGPARSGEPPPLPLSNFQQGPRGEKAVTEGEGGYPRALVR